MDEATESSILGPDGKPLGYRPQGLGFVGFYKLKERRVEEDRD
ncbi:hypothetical protein [Ensifer sp. ENS04]|nr:hypothetical protein [Ensifer sp. ENS04]